MKLIDVLELGSDCGLEDVGEAMLNVDLHAPSLFAYSEMDSELNEMYAGYHALVLLGGSMETSIVDAIELIKS